MKNDKMVQAIKNNRTKLITLRLTAAEYQQLDSRFKATICRKFSDYLRKVLLAGKVTVLTRNQSLDDFMTEMIELRKQLNAIGNNFNQAVRRLHILETIPEFREWIFLHCIEHEILKNKVDEIKKPDQSICGKMVARIKSTQSLSRSLNYNEKKLQLGVAECIQAVNYPKDLEALNFYDKLHRLEHQAALNERVKANSVHISLNFHENDKLSEEKLCTIAENYMQEIGFERQPYLVYRHYDAGHPHIHIVSTNIQRDGSKIEMHNIGRNQSEKARKHIELKFRLTQAEGRGQKEENQLKLRAQRIHYGKTQTKQAITNVLDTVINHYKYTSLPELNAILKQYNVMADRGKEDTTMYQKGGLVYTALDDDGNKIGTPIKASAFYSKPTLAVLEQRFRQNEVLRQEHKKTLKTKIDWVLFRGPRELNGFTNELQKEGVHVAIRRNPAGIVYGLTYIDHINKTVFNGSDIGKEYSAKAMMEKFDCFQEKQSSRQAQTMGLKFGKLEEKDVADEMKKKLDNALVELLKPVQEDNYMPNQLLKKKKQKKIRLRL